MNRGRLVEVAGVFAKLGCVAFGGPAAHIAMFERECVEQRRWLDRQRFLDLIGITNLIPGPNSTELAMHLGYQRAGMLGLVTAGACFILPAAGLTAILAALYVHLGELPAVLPILAGIKPVVAALIALALWKLGKKALASTRDYLVAALAVGALLLGLSEIQALLLCLLTAVPLTRAGGAKAACVMPLAAVGTPLATGVGAAAAAPTLFSLGLFFLKVGAVLYGSGYVLIAFLEADLVSRWQWLTQAQLLDAIAIGQMTPGPILTTSTAVGWILLGPWGAVVATLGIFLPSFTFVAITSPFFERLRDRDWVNRFLRAVNAGAVSLMAIAAVKITAGACNSIAAATLALVALGLLIKTKINPILLIAGGALAGLAIGLL